MLHKPLQPEGDILAQDFIPSCSCLVLSHDTGELCVKAAPFPINMFLPFVLLYWFATSWLPRNLTSFGVFQYCLRRKQGHIHWVSQLCFIYWNLMNILSSPMVPAIVMPIKVGQTSAQVGEGWTYFIPRDDSETRD